VIAYDKEFAPFELREQFAAAGLPAGAEVAQMIDQVIVADDCVPAPDHLPVHCDGVRKGALLIQPYILISEMGIRDQEDPALLFSGVHSFLLVLPRLKGAFP
jgi:hypothetical protein